MFLDDTNIDFRSSLPSYFLLSTPPLFPIIVSLSNSFSLKFSRAFPSFYFLSFLLLFLTFLSSHDFNISQKPFLSPFLAARPFAHSHFNLSYPFLLPPSTATPPSFPSFFHLPSFFILSLSHHYHPSFISFFPCLSHLLLPCRPYQYLPLLTLFFPLFTFSHHLQPCFPHLYLPPFISFLPSPSCPHPPSTALPPSFPFLFHLLSSLSIPPEPTIYNHPSLISIPLPSPFFLSPLFPSSSPFHLPPSA